MLEILIPAVIAAVIVIVIWLLGEETVLKIARCPYCKVRNSLGYYKGDFEPDHLAQYRCSYCGGELLPERRKKNEQTIH